MRAPVKLTRENVRAYLDRPWHLFERANAEHWREQYEADPGSAFAHSEALRAEIEKLGHTTDPDARRADFEAHVRLRALLDRTTRDLPPR